MQTAEKLPLDKIDHIFIAGWKKEYKHVWHVIVEDKQGYFKKPDRKTLMYASTVMQTNPMKFNEIIANSCFLGGDIELLEDDDYFFGLAAQLGALVEVKAGEIKKL
jgi:hypothetical protein